MNYTNFLISLSAGMGNKIYEAILTTILGMGIVFVVLILISILISLFKYIPKLFEPKSNNNLSKSAPAPKVEEVKTSNTSMEESNDDLLNDTQLVAVITAAIMASMGEETPEDGLVIRSIRRKTKYNIG
mgnify:CR=1 FL=1